MRGMNRACAILAAVVAACPFLAAAQGASMTSTTPLPSQVFDWTALKPVPIANGERRQVLDTATPTVDNLHVHVTSLAAGKASGEPTRHVRDEVLIVKDGEVEVHIDGRTQTAGAGSVLYFASGAVTRLRNAGSVPATYFVVNYATPKTPKE
jgi:XRE family transcriptional regulator, regulator of sulfur utilization